MKRAALRNAMPNGKATPRCIALQPRCHRPVWDVALQHEGEWRCTPPRSKEGPAPTPSGVGLAAPRAPAAAMLHDLITSFLVAFAAITPSEFLTKIWESL